MRRVPTSSPLLTLPAILALVFASPSISAQRDPGPQPPVVRPGSAGGAPSDAVVLFDGKDLSGWTGREGREMGWAVIDGAMTVTARKGGKEPTGTWDAVSKAQFTDAQIHVEFRIPKQPDARGQAKGNSGVMIQGRYELQVLDSWENPTAANGSNGALYGRSAPLVNASLPPGEWQVFDIIFRAPKCAADGSTEKPGSLTVLHNGVLIQENTPVVPRRQCVSEPGPLVFQDHYHPDVPDTPIAFRNVWFRPL